MNFIIEDGYNTSYISILFTALFYTESMIERCFLIDNNNENLNNVLLQKTITNNFVKRMRNELSITSTMLNEIRLCLLLCGWVKENKCKSFCEHDVIDFLIFLLKLLNVPTIKLDQSLSENYIIQCSTLNDVQLSYNNWAMTHNIINLPIFIIIKINLTSEQFSINKKIKLFNDEHIYSNIKWLFHSALIKCSDNYSVIMYKNDKLLTYSQNNFPCIEPFNIEKIANLNNLILFLIYKKEISL